MNKLTRWTRRLLSAFVRSERDFIMHAAHELRTPMTIIKGFAEALEEIHNMPPEQVREIAKKIAQSCERLDRVIKALLTLHDLDDKVPMVAGPCSISELLNSCQHAFALLHPQAELVIETCTPVQEVFADGDMLELALINLLDNAAKYSPKKAKVHVRLSKERDVVSLSVTDQGMGIPETHLKRIFERFYCVDKARSRKLGGAGLGLSIVKAIAEKHRGNVTVSSAVGQGTTFTLHFPETKGFVA